MSDLLNRINTEKSSKVEGTINLVKKGDSHSINLKKNNGELSFNLNWNSKSESTSRGFFAKLKNTLTSDELDLDLGCMYELKNGEIGVIQALGNSFGSLNTSPFISLDGDDRSGNNTNGETLRFSKIENIKFAVIFAFIYEGAPNWKEAQGTATIKQPNSPDIIVNLNDDSSKMMVGIATLSNDNSNLKVQKLEKYYHTHKDLDDDFGFGFTWTEGRK